MPLFASLPLQAKTHRAHKFDAFFFPSLSSSFFFIPPYLFPPSVHLILHLPGAAPSFPPSLCLSLCPGKTSQHHWSQFRFDALCVQNCGTCLSCLINDCYTQNTHKHRVIMSYVNMKEVQSEETESKKGCEVLHLSGGVTVGVCASMCDCQCVLYVYVCV